MSGHHETGGSYFGWFLGWLIGGFGAWEFLDWVGKSFGQGGDKH